MKHGVAFRKFSRTSEHRMLMLRNLVTALFEHEQIKTTLPKARDTARLAEKIITMGKKGDHGSQRRASAFLLKPAALSNLFSTFAQRYADRPGGYTRIHKFGNRPGDNAPHAILELVDNPRDLRWEMTSRAIGREMLREKLKNEEPALQVAPTETLSVVNTERNLAHGEKGILRPMTRWNLQKILRYRGEKASREISEKASQYADELLATPMAVQTMHEDLKEKNPHVRASRLHAGQVLPGDTRPALVIAQGKLARSATPPARYQKPTFSLVNALTERVKHP